MNREGPNAGPWLTVGIPTWNRAASVARIVEDGLRNAPEGVTMLVVDDGSDDDTLQRLTALGADADGRLEAIRSDRNSGFAAALATLMERTRTGTMMLFSDDDVIEWEGVRALGHLLALPRVHIPGYLEEGHGDVRSFPEKYDDDITKTWRMCGHAPGIVLPVDARATAALREEIGGANVFARTYPQVVIALDLVARGVPIRRAPAITGRSGERLPSGLRDDEGLPYWSSAARIRQYLALQEMLRRWLDQPSGRSVESIARTIRWNAVKYEAHLERWADELDPTTAARLRPLMAADAASTERALPARSEQGWSRLRARIPGVRRRR